MMVAVATLRTVISRLICLASFSNRDSKEHSELTEQRNSNTKSERSVVQSNIPSAFYESVDGAANRKRSETDARTDPGSKLRHSMMA